MKLPKQLFINLTSKLPLSLRIVLLVLAVSGTLMVAMLWTGYRLLVADYQALVAQRESAQISRLASSLELSLQNRIFALEAFAMRLLDDNGKLRTQAELQAITMQPGRTSAIFPDGLLVFDAQATAVAESSHVPGRIGTNYRDRPHFVRLLASLEPVISEPILGRTTGLPLISFLVPVHAADGELVAIAGGVLDLSKTPLLSSSPLLPQAVDGVITQVIDPQHRMFVSMDTPFNKPLPLPPAGTDALVDAAVAQMPSGTLVRQQQKSFLIASEQLDALGWVVLRAIAYDDAIAPARVTFRRFILISLLAALLVILISWRVARSLTKPLARMTQRVGRMADDAGYDSAFIEQGSPEVVALAQAMNRLTRERKALEQLKGDFISSVSHELRTPLTSLYGGLKLLNAGALGALPERAQDLVALSLRNSERLQVLIADLLDFNRLMAGQVTLKLQPCQLLSAAEQAIADMALTADDLGIHFSLVLTPAAWVEADPKRLRQVLDNLLSNAIKHSPMDSCIRLSLVPVGNCWRLVVSDQGDGVPEEFAPRVFQRFAQAEQGNKRQATGTGLGLAISRALVRQMQGDMGFYNDQGAHFWFELPVAKAHEPEDQGMDEQDKHEHSNR